MPNSGTSFGVSDPDLAFADPRYSHGAIVLAAGNHQISVFTDQSCCGGGGAYLRASVPGSGTVTCRYAPPLPQQPTVLKTEI